MGIKIVIFLNYTLLDGDLLQILQCVVNHLLANVGGGSWAHRVVLVGIDHHIVVLACGIEAAAHLHRVLEVDIIVGSAVDNQ